MIEKQIVTIPSLTGDTGRKAYIYLPQSYGYGERYPVLYMFDGHNLFDDSEATFGKSWGLSRFLDENNVPLIVAAVECNRKGNERLSEYSPEDFGFKGGEKIRGRGKKYMDWLVGEFKPYIDDNFDTLKEREYTFIGGSSMGGLMTIYALAKYSDIFSRGAALSPSLWIGGEQILPKFLKSAKFKYGTHLYVDYGSCEFKNHATQKRAFAEACSIFIERGVNLTARIIDGGTHDEASWERQIPYFLAAFGF